MKKFITAIFLFVSLNVYSQKDDFKINTEIDEFTGDTTIRSELFYFNPGFGGPDLRLGLTTAKNETYLIVVFGDDDLRSVHTDDKIFFKLDDGTMITAYSMSSEISDIVSLGNYRLILVYKITLEDIEKLASTPIAKVRLETTDGNIDIDTGGKKYPPSCMANIAEYYNTVIAK